MWHLNQIPKIAHLYWGNEKLSFLRYMTVESFARLNPDWRVNVYVPVKKYNGKGAWNFVEHQKKYVGEKDYFPSLKNIENVSILEKEFPGFGVPEETIPEPIKSDYLRWGLLAEVGGLWLDMDIVFYRPVNDFVWNKPENSEINTFYCADLGRWDPNCGCNMQSIGFLLSSSGNGYYRHLQQESWCVLGRDDYQGLGAKLLNRVNIGDKGVQARFEGLIFANIGLDTVYPVMNFQYGTMDQNVGWLFGQDESFICPDTIGLHWYGGFGMSTDWENTITDENYRYIDNVICRKIKEIRG